MMNKSLTKAQYIICCLFLLGFYFFLSAYLLITPKSEITNKYDQSAISISGLDNSAIMGVNPVFELCVGSDFSFFKALNYSMYNEEYVVSLDKMSILIMCLFHIVAIDCEKGKTSKGVAATTQMTEYVVINEHANNLTDGIIKIRTHFG